MEERQIRAVGVLTYWIVLAFAVGGNSVSERLNPELAYVLLIHAIGIKVLHLPLVMNPRLRIPLMDPLVVMLSGSGLVRVFDWRRNKDRHNWKHLRTVG